MGSLAEMSSAHFLVVLWESSLRVVLAAPKVPKKVITLQLFQKDFCIFASSFTINDVERGDKDGNWRVYMTQ